MLYLLSIDPSYKAFAIIMTLCIVNVAIDIYRRRKTTLPHKNEKVWIVPFAREEQRSIALTAEENVN